MKVTDNSGATDTATHEIVIGGNSAPVATFTTTPANPLSGDEVTFTSTSTDSDGTIASLAWDLDNDGNFDDGSKVEMKKTFLLPGPQIVRLRVVDNDGDFDVAQTTVNVVNRAPVPAISALPNAPLSLEPVTFTAGGTDPDGTHRERRLGPRRRQQLRDRGHRHDRPRARSRRRAATPCGFAWPTTSA